MAGRGSRDCERPRRPGTGRCGAPVMSRASSAFSSAGGVHAFLGGMTA